jgi:tetratricopeptide (TPR) repeat protein
LRWQHAPESHTLLTNRALARTRLGRHADAVADARRACAAAPRWAKAHARLGSALAAGSKHAEAAAAYEHAAWLADTHERDTSAQEEYEQAALACKRGGMLRAGRGAINDGGF